MDQIATKFSNKYVSAINSRLQIFIDGLRPITDHKNIFGIISLSLCIWSIELFVYYSISQAYSVPLNIGNCIMFMVVVNFSSLIPSAPGAIGTIELFATKALVTIGVLKETALAMVLSQHLIQYLVVGIPGLIFMLTWKAYTQSISDMRDEPSNC